MTYLINVSNVTFGHECLIYWHEAVILACSNSWASCPISGFPHRRNSNLRTVERYAITISVTVRSLRTFWARVVRVRILTVRILSVRILAVRILSVRILTVRILTVRILTVRILTGHRFYIGRTQADRTEGEKRGWRTDGVICIEGNRLWHSGWREAGLAR